MKKYLSEAEYDAVKARLRNQEASLSITRSIARQFFTRVSNRSVVEITGESILAKKIVVWTGLLVPTVMLVACLLAVILHFGWAAAIGAPLVGMFWTVIAGFTGDKGNWIHTVVGLVLGLAPVPFLEPAYAIPLTLFTVSLCLQRCVFQLSELWVVDLVSRSFGAYDMLVEHIDLEDPELTASQG